MKLGVLAQLTGARLLGDAGLEVVRVCAVVGAGPDDLAFVGHAHDRRNARLTRAAALIVDDEFAAEHADELPCSVLCAADTSLLLARCIELLHPLPTAVRRVHESAVVAASAVVGVDVEIAAGVVIGEGCVVGDGCVIGANVVLGDGVRLGRNVRIGPGCVLGDDGFVFASDGRPVRHLGAVVVDDDVWLGANVCVDRGLLQHTRVGARSKIDNLVQVAHDVVIGVDVVIAACVGIAGHAVIGDGAGIAGQAGINPHVIVAPRVRIGGQSGVTTDVDIDGAAVSGTPAFAHRDWLKAMAHQRRAVFPARKNPTPRESR